MESDQNSIHNLKSFLEKISTVDKTLTQLPRGSWVINITAEHHRLLFKNRDKINLKYDVKFTKVRTTLTKFLARERLAINALEVGIKPLRDIIKNQPTSPNLSMNDTNQALSAFKVYNLQMKTHATHVKAMQVALKESLSTTKAGLTAYLEDKPAGQKIALEHYNGFETQIKQTVSRIREILNEEIPSIYSEAIKLLETTKSTSL
ncbi:hypothetical protein [Lacinutrix sp. MEBiC02404]